MDRSRLTISMRVILDPDSNPPLYTLCRQFIHLFGWLYNTRVLVLMIRNTRYF
jgi:hypothetical protein